MKKAIWIALSALSLSGCSVYMATRVKGTDIDDLVPCKTKTCLVVKGAEPIKIPELPPNVEAYRVLKPEGSYGRAVMHGILDVATWGIWEIAGTPMEGRYDKDQYYGLRVTYEPGTENIQHIDRAD